MSMELMIERHGDIAAVVADPEAAGVGDGDHPTCDLHKAWHGIHFLLCGHAWDGALPEGFLVGDGTELDELDMGYGPARAFDAAQTAAIAAALSDLDTAALLERFDAEEVAAADLYSVRGEPDDEEFIAHFYDKLRPFVLEAAAAGDGLVVYLT